ncbi:MAG: DNA primase DnaG [Nanoarchaeota archaeon]
MAKISPVSIKYMIHANFTAEGALEKPDVIGAIFGQTEGLLGDDLEMRELQKEGKIGRIEVETERNDKKTTGIIKIPTALDRSETTLIAAAIETIERIGPSDSQIEVERIEDVRGSKRDYIIERAKKLMQGIEGATDSREISNEIKDSAKMAGINEYGDEKLPSGDISGSEIIVVEGRADVLNLMKNGVKNVIAMNGTKLPEAIKQLGKEKEITLFVDGDRGGKLIIQNVTDNANISYIAVAPEGKEVEELTGKEILMNLRKRTPLQEFLSRERYPRRISESNESIKDRIYRTGNSEDFNNTEKKAKDYELDDEKKKKLKEISNEIYGKEKVVMLDKNLNEIKIVSVKSLNISLRKSEKKVFALVIDGTVTSKTIESAEEAGVDVIVAKNFSTTDTNIKLLSL